MNKIKVEPKLVFRPYEKLSLTIEYGLDWGYAGGTFTPAGLREHHLVEIKEWCHNYLSAPIVMRMRPSEPLIQFANDKDYLMFLLRWT
jgi:hypothetical protein